MEIIQIIDFIRFYPSLVFIISFKNVENCIEKFYHESKEGTIYPESELKN